MILKTYLFIIANNLLRRIGLRLISQKAISNIETIIKNSVQKVQDEDIQHYKGSITCIIFSKDRPLQLYALLESISKRWYGTINYKIIYKASSSSYTDAYDLCKDESTDLNLQIEWIEQKLTFKEVLLSTLSQVTSNRLLFLTDDNVAIAEFDTKTLPVFNHPEQIISLRHSPKITSSYNLRRSKIKQPFFERTSDKSVLGFRWFEGSGEWADPYSLDGHIYSTSHIKSIIHFSAFLAPNSLELSMKYFGFLQSQSKAYCYPQTVIVNIPLNLTQTEWRNRHNGLELHEALSLWQSGLKLDVDSISVDQLTSTHVPLNLNIVTRLQNEF